MDIKSSYLHSHDAPCAFPSWPRRSSLDGEDRERPTAFLSDEGNAVHAGFLSVARAMVVPVAARLRALLTANPARRAASLLFTGHSAGAAVAALLYAHMLSGHFSELSELADDSGAADLDAGKREGRGGGAEGRVAGVAVVGVLREDGSGWLWPEVVRLEGGLVRRVAPRS